MWMNVIGTFWRVTMRELIHIVWLVILLKHFLKEVQNDNSCAKDNTAFLFYLIWIRQNVLVE